MKQSLLEQAKSIKTGTRIKRKFSKEEIDLAVAYARNEITFTQVRKVLGIEQEGSNVYAFLARALQDYFIQKAL